MSDLRDEALAAISHLEEYDGDFENAAKLRLYIEGLETGGAGLISVERARQMSGEGMSGLADRLNKLAGRGGMEPRLLREAAAALDAAEKALERIANSYDASSVKSDIARQALPAVRGEPPTT